MAATLAVGSHRVQRPDFRPSVTMVLTYSDKPRSNTRVDEQMGQQPL